MSTTETKHCILEEIEKFRVDFPQVEIHSATKNFLTLIYQKSPHRRIKTTLTFPDGYPDQHALLVDIALEKGIAPGLRKKLIKELSAVALENQTEHDAGQIEPVASRLISFIDTNKFVPCWKELKQVFDKVQQSAQSPRGKGSTITINDTKGIIKLNLKDGKYYYACSICIDDAYPNTLDQQDWGNACKLIVNSTNFPPKIETLLTTQAKELVRRMQDGMQMEEAVRMSNPIKPPDDLFEMKKKAPKVRLSQQVLKNLHKDVETMAHVRDLRNIDAARNPNNAKLKANSARDRKEARREIGKITQNEIDKDNHDDEEERQWQMEEKARIEGYNFADYDGSNPLFIFSCCIPNGENSTITPRALSSV
eukprot:CAMPEP_0178908960 /NCGR_PEP_ID=MMETSP0786-20121207/8220_1 /TAXON_ID=186022 /ORGANISM="Thalassionema frauenfeldii, Strain CCMP 1798" /LENGTH=365 /DNA_ID=CAMNT_0020580935 /DNA_START=160 /DNA_END=1257 /DNA_ORIENTATION=-